MTDSFNPQKVWLLDDGRRGHFNQSLGVASALGIDKPDIVKLRFSNFQWLLIRILSALAFNPVVKILKNLVTLAAGPDLLRRRGGRESSRLPSSLPPPDVAAGKSGEVWTPRSNTIVAGQNEKRGVTRAGERRTFMAKLIGVSPPYPDLLIAAGRRNALVSRWIKKKNPPTFAVQILTPPGDASIFDVVAGHAHDHAAAAPNRVTTLGAANVITPARLAAEAAHWKNALSIGSRRLTVLVGGPRKGGGGFETKDVNPFCDTLLAFIARHGFGAILLTVSRRTPPDAVSQLRQNLAAAGLPLFFYDPTDGDDNPYPALLSFSEAVVATADSISMISEAATAPLPVYAWGLNAAMRGKFRAFYQTMIEEKRLAPLSAATPLLAKPEKPLADAQKIADFIRARWRQERV